MTLSFPLLSSKFFCIVVLSYFIFIASTSSGYSIFLESLFRFLYITKFSSFAFEIFQYYRPFVFHLYSSDFLRLLHFFLILVPFSLYNIKFSNPAFLSNFLFIASTSSSSTLSSLCIFFRLSSLLYGFFSYFYTFSSSFMLPEFQLLCSSSIFFLLSSLVYVDVFLTSTRFPLPSCCQNLIFFAPFLIIV